MTNHLDIVPVRTDYKGCVVMSVIGRPKSRSTVICRPRGDRRFVEAIYLLSIAGYEGKVQMCCRLFDPTDAERCITAGTTKLRSHRTFGHHGHPQRLESCKEKGFTGGIVAYPKYDVIKHSLFQSSLRCLG